MNNHVVIDNIGDANDKEIGAKTFKTDKSENAMLRSRIEEQGQLICYLKQRADQQLKRLNTLEEINNELHMLRTQAQEESKERLRTCKMMEKRFQELAENHEEMIKIKDEYKFQSHTLTVENLALKEQIRKNFSETLNEREKTIEDLNSQLTISEEKFKTLQVKTDRIQNEMEDLKLKSDQKIKSKNKELDTLKLERSKLNSELTKLKQAHDQHSAKDSEALTTMKKENDRLIDELMIRGKLLQERQIETDDLKKEVEEKENRIRLLVEEFEKKKSLVDSNLRVQTLQEEKDRLDTELVIVNRKFEAFRLHSRDLLQKEKDLNSKLRSSSFIP